MYPKLANYPKSEKFSICQSIKENFFALMKYISLGNSVKSKRLAYLQEADGHLQTLKVLMKLSKQRKYISVGFFREVDLELTEINKLLSGYIRSANK
ncbi:MAG: four helix bundle protein [Clostridiaceae bacterium]|nr:four helix bundle protein [Clostridiaceae bacterium]